MYFYQSLQLQEHAPLNGSPWSRNGDDLIVRSLDTIKNHPFMGYSLADVKGYAEFPEPASFQGVRAHMVYKDSTVVNSLPDMSAGSRGASVTKDIKIAIEQLQQNFYYFTELQIATLEDPRSFSKRFRFPSRNVVYLNNKHWFNLTREERGGFSNYKIGALNFLRKRPWARKKLEELHIFSLGGLMFFSEKMFAAIKNTGCNYANLVKMERVTSKGYSAGFVKVEI